MKVEERIAIEADRPGILHQQFDRRLVVQNHLRFEQCLAPGRLAVLDQLARIEPGVGIAFQMAGSPREVDQEAGKDGSTMSPRGCSRPAGVAHPPQLAAQRLGEVPRLVGLVGVEKFALESHRSARPERPVHVSENVTAVRGKRNVAREGVLFGRGGWDRRRPGGEITTSAAPACRGDALLVDQSGDVALGGPARKLRVPGQQLGQRQAAGSVPDAMEQRFSRGGRGHDLVWRS